MKQTDKYTMHIFEIDPGYKTDFDDDPAYQDALAKYKDGDKSQLDVMHNIRKTALDQEFPDDEMGDIARMDINDPDVQAAAEKDIKKQKRIILKASIPYLKGIGLTVRKIPQPARVSKILHLRVPMSLENLEKGLEGTGITLSSNGVPNLSSPFRTLELRYPNDFEDPLLAGEAILIVLSIRKGTKVSSKLLTPANLKLTGKEYDRLSLAGNVKKALKGKINDPILYKFLSQLVDVAIDRRKAVDPKVMAQLKPTDLRMAGVDFGEILAPLVFSTEKDTIIFPAGNSMLADVEVDGHPISVKSGVGSGTSFRAIEKHIRTYDADVASKKIKLSKDEKYILKFFKAFIDTEGTNIDKIIAGSHAANTKEHQAMEKLVGTDITFDNLKKYSKQFKSYKSFLQAIHPIAVAGQRGEDGKNKPIGLPKDHEYYMGTTKKKPAVRQAGKPSWDAGKESAGANIMTYILGASFLADAKTDVNAMKYNKLIKDILGNVNASLIKVDITDDGKIESYEEHFQDANFAFQYHAPSNIAGNNLPGFSIKLN